MFFIDSFHSQMFGGISCYSIFLSRFFLEALHYICFRGLSILLSVCPKLNLRISKSPLCRAKAYIERKKYFVFLEYLELYRVWGSGWIIFYYKKIHRTFFPVCWICCWKFFGTFFPQRFHCRFPEFFFSNFMITSLSDF